MPLPAAAAYAVASSLIDVPSGRAAGVFVVDNTETRSDGLLPPSCVAFEAQNGSSLVSPLLVLFTIGHGLGDRTNATLTLPSAAAAVGAMLLNGYGTPLALKTSPNPDGSVTILVSIAPLPQYLQLSQGSAATASACCETLAW
jgi:hypothetical protein